MSMTCPFYLSDRIRKRSPHRDCLYFVFIIRFWLLYKLWLQIYEKKSISNNYQAKKTKQQSSYLAQWNKKKEARAMCPGLLSLVLLNNVVRLAELAGTVADDDVVDLGLVAVLGIELLLSRCNELAVEVVANEVDGAAAKATAHDT